MPRTSSQTVDVFFETSTSVAGRAAPPRTGTAGGTAPFPRDLLPGDLPNRAQSSVSATAALAAHSPAPRRARAGSCSSLPRASVHLEKSPSHTEAAAETLPETARRRD